MVRVQVQKDKATPLYLTPLQELDKEIEALLKATDERIIHAIIAGNIRLWPDIAQYNLAKSLWPPPVKK